MPVILAAYAGHGYGPGKTKDEMPSGKKHLKGDEVVATAAEADIRHRILFRKFTGFASAAELIFQIVL